MAKNTTARAHENRLFHPLGQADTPAAAGRRRAPSCSSDPDVAPLRKPISRPGLAGFLAQTLAMSNQRFSVNVTAIKPDEESHPFDRYDDRTQASPERCRSNAPGMSTLARDAATSCCDRRAARSMSIAHRIGSTMPAASAGATNIDIKRDRDAARAAAESTLEYPGEQYAERRRGVNAPESPLHSATSSPIAMSSGRASAARSISTCAMPSSM